ncbi:hypothetical protein ATN79_45750 [Paraburkholderia caribensis]|nr:hypothetical protein ATN79_45750 [Paraburkholderia caribensis]
MNVASLPGRQTPGGGRARQRATWVHRRAAHKTARHVGATRARFAGRRHSSRSVARCPSFSRGRHG